MIPVDPERLEAAYRLALDTLLKERHPEGYWVGELASSALATATAVMALYLYGSRRPRGDRILSQTERVTLRDVQRERTTFGDAGCEGEAADDVVGERAALIDAGLRWLVEHQNADGGWGDTDRSFSNISTTMLCRAAFYLTGKRAAHAEAVARAERWLCTRYGSTPAQLAAAVRQRYGSDRTFATPILTTCALAGLVDWREVPPLPFELACLPQAWFRFLRLHVVSYALPALIAIGQCIYHHRKPRNPLTRLARQLAIGPSLRVLERIQPTSGGFLEATPLTSFVTLSLAACGRADHVVARNGVGFLLKSVRPDGSWPIDTNLSTWVTTLAVNALAAAGELERLERRDELCTWLLRQQFAAVHPYTGAAPGGWAWTPLPGGVPDADDTPGAILALAHLAGEERHRQALAAGRDWLTRLQNSDGGVPTFCRGWGRLPFDRSGCDLTAHALRAVLPSIHEAMERKESFWTLQIDGPPILLFAEFALDFLTSQQRSDGSWLPLWFGNQHMPDDENPTYGTTRVLAALRDIQKVRLRDPQRQAQFESWWQTTLADSWRRGLAWLLANQNDDGGWGGGRGSPSSIEETSLALEILLDGPTPETADAVARGLLWLVNQIERGGLHQPAPIGFYFAKLWYYEKLYPIIFAVAALGRARIVFRRSKAE